MSDVGLLRPLMTSAEPCRQAPPDRMFAMVNAGKLMRDGTRVVPTQEVDMRDGTMWVRPGNVGEPQRPAARDNHGHTVAVAVDAIHLVCGLPQNVCWHASACADARRIGRLSTLVTGSRGVLVGVLRLRLTELAGACGHGCDRW